MKTPQIPAMPNVYKDGLYNYTRKIDAQSAATRQWWLNEVAKDQKTVAERKWQAGKLAPVAQKPCDHGLFSDDAKQTDLIAILQTRGE